MRGDVLDLEKKKNQKKERKQSEREASCAFFFRFLAIFVVVTFFRKGTLT